MYLGQGKNCKYVLKTPGLFDDTTQEFKSEKDLDIYIESLLNSDVVIDGETAIFSVDHLARTRQLLDQVKADVESVAEKRTRFKSSEAIFHNDGEMEYETYYIIPNSIGTTRLITTKGRSGNLSQGLITPFNLAE